MAVDTISSQEANTYATIKSKATLGGAIVFLTQSIGLIISALNVSHVGHLQWGIVALSIFITILAFAVGCISLALAMLSPTPVGGTCDEIA
jgi:glucose uptake protein GlcU